MKNVLLAIFGIALLAVFGVYAFSANDDCKSYCNDVFASISDLDVEINDKAREIAYAATHVEDDSIIERLNEVHPKYLRARRTLDIAHYLYDFTGAFTDAGVTIPGYTYENAAKVATVGVVKLNAVVAELDDIAEDLRQLLDPEKEA